MVRAVKQNKPVQGFSKQFMEHLKSHDWQGNIRELKNVVERAVILTVHEKLTPDMLPPGLQKGNQKKRQTWSVFELNTMEKMHIERILKHTGGNKVEAARLMNIGLTTLYRKIEEYHLHTPQWKNLDG
ncbi:MAG TPA: helix-turn-helix domain-containing protein [Puia sp.]